MRQVIGGSQVILQAEQGLFRLVICFVVPFGNQHTIWAADKYSRLVHHWLSAAKLSFPDMTGNSPGGLQKAAIRAGQPIGRELLDAGATTCAFGYIHDSTLSQSKFFL